MAERMTARKKQAMEMRRRIQSVALDLFDRDGFENVSVEQIAQAAGCSVGNIYHYFKGKDELAVQVTGPVDATYLELEEAYDKSGMSAAEKLIDFVGQSLIVSSQEEVLYKSFIHSLKHPEQGILAFRQERVYFRLLKKLIAASLAEGSLSAQWSEEELFEELVALHRGILFQWRIEEGSFDLSPFGQRMARRLLHL